MHAFAGSSRTDAGVHAFANTCHVDLHRVSKRGELLDPHDPKVVHDALNFFLRRAEQDIEVVGVRRVSSDFHARHAAIARTYRYYVVDQHVEHAPVFDGSVASWLQQKNPATFFDNDFAWAVRKNKNQLDTRAMQEALQLLQGTHDFSSFRSIGCTSPTPVKEMYRAELETVDDAGIFPGSRRICITLKANAFLYHQVCSRSLLCVLL